MCCVGQEVNTIFYPHGLMGFLEPFPLTCSQQRRIFVKSPNILKASTSLLTARKHNIECHLPVNNTKKSTLHLRIELMMQEANILYPTIGLEIVILYQCV